MIKVGIKSIEKSHQGRGIETYTLNLVEALKKTADLEIIEFEDLNKLRYVNLVHYPFFDFFKPTLPLRKKFPTIVTIHDVTPLIFRDHYPPGIKGYLSLMHQRASLLNTSGVITDSLSSKKDVQKYLQIKDEKIYPIYLAPPSKFRKIADSKLLSEIKIKFNLPDVFVVYFSNVNWNKNILGLAKACKIAGLDLVLISSGFEQRQNLEHTELKDFKRFLGEYENDPKIHILGYVSLEDLVSIINLASIAALVSYYEGFGLPILEAQACGTVVVAAETSSMPEIAGKGAIFVDPYNPHQIAESFLRLLKNGRLRTNLTNLGFENVKKLSWKKTAMNTFAVYEKILNNEKQISFEN